MNGWVVVGVGPMERGKVPVAPDTQHPPPPPLKLEPATHLFLSPFESYLLR